MKKLIVLLISVITVSATFAQQRNPWEGKHDRYEPGYRNEKYNDRSRGHSDDRGYDRDRRAEWERMNRDYDQRISQYRTDRRMSSYERNRRIQEVERERQQKANSFGKGLAIGGIAGVIIGVLIGR